MKFLLPLLILASCSNAADLGRVGNVFPIKEESFQTMIKKRLKKMTEEEREEAIRKLQEEVLNPKPASSLPRAKENKEYPFNPTHVVEKDVRVANGRVMYPKGHIANPLDHMEFDIILYFIDGDDEDQLRWFQNQINPKHEREQRVVLVKGSTSKITRKLNRKVYFDQVGELVMKFKIMALPAMVWQNKGEKYLRVKEVAIP